MTSAPPQKAYRRGAHRTFAPERTLERFIGKANALGVTRLADITGLDYIGIPVCVAVRPNGRALSIAQGKGIDCASARTSAFMEAAEFAQAENIARPRLRRSTLGMRSDVAIADPHLLPRQKGFRWSEDAEIDWIEGRDLASGERTFVPFEIVHTDHTLPQNGADAIFRRSSNGLGAGNNHLEAIIAGLCELIERDATCLWRLLGPECRAARRVKLRGVNHRGCRELLDHYVGQQISVALWDATSDVGVACFICRIRETENCKREPLGDFWGAGCHLDRDVALIRALTEAGQSRLTYIVGARDDLEPALYVRERAAPFAALIDLWEQKVAGRSYGDVPSLSSPTSETDVETLLQRLQAVGLSQIVVVDLTDEKIGIPVVRMVVPGLEADDAENRLRMGARARAFAKALR